MVSYFILKNQIKTQKLSTELQKQKIRLNHYIYNINL